LVGERRGAPSSLPRGVAEGIVVACG
jgi:hypothetical protein